MNIANLLDDFLLEASAHVDKLEAAFLDAQALVDDAQALEDVYRAAHSLKGMAGFFQLSSVVSLSHSLENVLSALRSKVFALRESHVDIILQAVDCLRDMVRTAKEEQAPDVSGYMRALEELLPGPAPTTTIAQKETLPPVDTVKIPDEVKETLPRLVRHGQKIYRIRLAFDRALPVYFHHPRLLFENIASVGTVLDATCTLTASHEVPAIVAALETGKGCTLELLVASVLEADLLVIATELAPEAIAPVALEDTPPPPAAASEPAPVPETRRAKATAAVRDEVIRLGVSQVNQLLDLSSQMVLARNQLLSVLEGQQKTIPGLTGVLQEINRITTEMQDKVMRTRMQPVSFAFNRFPRVIRDMARKLNKELVLEVDGEDISLDKMLIEALIDPLTHLIRNAADHGIEPPEERLRAGKPAIGTIRLRAYMSNNMVTIETQDDGRGIDLMKVTRAALEKGIATQQQLDAMSTDEAYALLFRQSLSTSERVTDVSGRGVGMDVVKTNVEKLGGTVEIESQPGQGTLIRLRMPRTLAIVPSLVTATGGVLCAVPQTYIAHILRVNRREGARVATLGSLRFLPIDGEYLPAVSLATLHAAAGRQDWPSADEDADIAIIIRQEGISFALLVSAVVGLEETLAKPLPTLLRDSFCYSGVTILGSGQAVPMLDPVGVARMLSLETAQTPASEKEVEAQAAADAATLETLVIFQCSGSEYYAIPMEGIYRIEAIGRERLQSIGEGVYINLGERTVRVVRLEDALPVQRKAYTQEKLYLIVPRQGGGKVALLARRILSHERIPMWVDQTQFAHPYLHGTVRHQEKILLLPRLDDLLAPILHDDGAPAGAVESTTDEADIVSTGS